MGPKPTLTALVRRRAGIPDRRRKQAAFMIFPVVLLLPLAASAGLYLWFRSLNTGKTYWRIVVKVAAVVAATRIGLVTIGVYVLWHTSGWLQLPAYAMVLCGLPEELLMLRRIGPSVAVLAGLSALLMAGSATWVFTIAGLAARGKPPS
jgi:hypothetical protein